MFSVIIIGACVFFGRPQLTERVEKDLRKLMRYGVISGRLGINVVVFIYGLDQAE